MNLGSPFLWLIENSFFNKDAVFGSLASALLRKSVSHQNKINSNRIDLLKHYLWTCPCNKLSLCNCLVLADVVEIHPGSLSRYFSRKYGQPLVSLIRVIKVIRALDMLRTGDVTSLDDAMKAVGYRDRKYFARIVREQFGVGLRQLERDVKQPR